MERITSIPTKIAFAGGKGTWGRQYEISAKDLRQCSSLS